MDQEYVIHNGIRMVKGWPEKIAEAQTIAHWSIDGVLHERIKYGNEQDDWGADTRPCHDCRVVKGQYHVPGCDVERCPVCGGQVIGCDCNYDEDEEE